VEADNCHISVAVDLDNRGSALACLGRDPVDHVAGLAVDVEDVARPGEAVLLSGLGLAPFLVVLRLGVAVDGEGRSLVELRQVSAERQEPRLFDTYLQFEESVVVGLFVQPLLLRPVLLGCLRLLDLIEVFQLSVLSREEVDVREGFVLILLRVDDVRAGEHEVGRDEDARSQLDRPHRMVGDDDSNVPVRHLLHLFLFDVLDIFSAYASRLIFDPIALHYSFCDFSALYVPYRYWARYRLGAATKRSHRNFFKNLFIKYKHLFAINNIQS
jgi:hypothetical protein